MKKRYFLLLCAFLLTIFAQESMAQRYKFLPKDSRMLTAEEVREKRIGLGMPTYLQDGEKLDQLRSMKYLTDPGYDMEVWANESGQPIALVVKEASAEDRERRLNAMIKRMEVSTGPWKDKTAPGFEVMDMEGNTVDLESLKGKVVALNFWFIGCKPCILEMPELNELVEKYKEQDVEFVALALDDKNQLTPFLQRTAFDYQVIPKARTVSRLYEVPSYPSHFLLDREGKVQFFQAGYNGALTTVLDRKIAELLASESK